MIRNGRVICHADPQGDVPHLGLGAAALREGRGVLLARNNWHVHVLGTNGAVQWNVSYSRVQQLSLGTHDDMALPTPTSCAFPHSLKAACTTTHFQQS